MEEHAEPGAVPDVVNAPIAIPVTTDVPPAERFFNRELSWLSFNRRVLAEAKNTDYPLLERLRFLSISGNNLDEFMMVRVAGLAGQVRRQIDETSIDGLTPSQQLRRIYAKVTDLIEAQQVILQDLSVLLDELGIHLIGEEKLDKAETEWLANYFQEHVLPALTPQAIDPARSVVRLGNGDELPYDRVVLSPGVTMLYDEIEGMAADARDKIVHAWKAGPQTLALRRQLEAIRDGGVFVISVPRAP